MILVIGEILFDIFPDHRKMGGAPFNFAYHLKKLGFPVRFISRIGTDSLGREIMTFIKKNDFDPNDIQQDPAHATGTVRVSFSGSVHSFTITPDAAWDHLAFDRRLAKHLEDSPELLYFGSLIQRTGEGQELIGQIMDKKSSSTRVFCDINLRPDAYTRQSVLASLAASNILKLSHEEVAIVASFSGHSAGSPENAARYLLDTYELDLIILTLGHQGSAWFFPDKYLTAEAVAPEKLTDTVGAGDAYAAVAAACLMNGLSPETSMKLASSFSGTVCGISGALPDDEGLYRSMRERIYNK